MRSNKKALPKLVALEGLLKNGGSLLSRLRSTIGTTGLNFSVRNGKRWNPGVIAA